MKKVKENIYIPNDFAAFFKTFILAFNKVYITLKMSRWNDIK